MLKTGFDKLGFVRRNGYKSISHHLKQLKQENYVGALQRNRLVVRTFSSANEPKSNDSKSNSFFSDLKNRMNQELERNPEAKERLDQWKGVGSKSADNVSESFSKFSQATKDAAENIGSKAKDANQKYQEKFAENENIKSGYEKARSAFSGFSSKFSSNQGSDEKSDQAEPEQKTSRLDSFTKYLPKNFANDTTSWNDALRMVFGGKPTDQIRHREEMLKQRRASNAQEEEETSAEASHEVEVPENPGLVRIEELGKKISELEALREKVGPSAETPDVPEFRRLNKEIQALKKEIAVISDQINTSAIVHTPESQGTWDRFTENLKDTPLIKDILGFKEKIAKSEAVKSAKNAAEDARNVWETSQNPVVYRMYNVYEGVFKDNEYGEALKEFKKNDPDFNQDNILSELEEDVIPKVVSSYLRGDIRSLEELCEGDALHGIKASIKARQDQKRKMDPSILNIDHLNIMAMKHVDKVGPVVVVTFMVQQIDCLYDSKGQVIEGSDDKIVAVFYVMALTRKYFEEDFKFRFVCREFAVAGQQQYL